MFKRFLGALFIIGINTAVEKIGRDYVVMGFVAKKVLENPV